MTENERVRIIRKDHSLTMEEFGKRLGVAKNTISQIESCKNAVTNQMRAAILREFNVNETWFRTGDESAGRYVTKTEEDEITDLFTEILSAPLDDSLRALARAFAKLTPQQRQEAADLAKAMADAYNEDRHSLEVLPSAPEKNTAAARSGDRMDVPALTKEEEDALLPPPFHGDI